MTLQECDEIMVSICGKLGVEPCAITIHKYRRARKRAGHYHWKTRTIYLRAVSNPEPFHCVRRIFDLPHEIAHHVTCCHFGPRERHGIRFVDSLIDVVKAYYGEDNADEYLWANEYGCVLRRYEQLHSFSRQYVEKTKAARRARAEMVGAIKEALLKGGIPVDEVRPYGRNSFKFSLAPNVPPEAFDELARKGCDILRKIISKK